MLREPRPKQSFGESMAKMVDATQDGHLEAAESLEDFVESGHAPRKHEFACTLYAALGYDIANEPHSARRMYERLAKTEHPNLESFVLSSANSRLLTDSFARAGLRDNSGLESALSRLRKRLDSRKECMKHVDAAYRDDYTVLLATVNLLAEAIGALDSSDGGALKRANSNAALFHDDLEKFSPEPWIAITAALSARLIKKIAERAVASLKVPDRTKSALRERRILEVWKTQEDAVKGLLGGRSVVCSSPPGTGKSFMAYLAAGILERGEQMAYLVPTRSLSAQVFDDLQSMGHGAAAGQPGPGPLSVAISTRDRTEYDERLSEYGVVVSTYEKMGALVRGGKVDPARVKRVVADEIHIIGDEARGVAVEMALARLMEGSPQVIGLSGLLGDDDASLLSGWLGADPVESSWKSAKISEKILLDGTVYLRGGGEDKIPLLARPGSGQREKRMAAARHYSSLAVLNDEAVLISVPKRKDAFTVARELARGVRSPGLDDYGTVPIIENKMRRYKEAARRIKEIEPSIPEFGKHMIKMLESGVAYHHAGLPRLYRKVVEEGLKQGKIDVLVATTTLEAGVNMPIKTVVFFQPTAWDGAGQKPMDGRRYRNIAGRAGRAGYHRTGDVVVVATTPEELTDCQKRFWESGPEPLRSAFFGAVWKAPNPATSAFRSHVLSHVIASPGGGPEEIVGSLRKTWFYAQDSAASTKELESAVEGSVEVLERYGMICKQGGRLHPTPVGVKVSESGLAPDAAAAILPGLRRLDGGAREADMLLLACLSDDLQIHAHRAGRKAPHDCVRAAAENLQSGPEPPGSAEVERASKCASLLHCWIGPHTSSEIAESRGLGPEIGPPVSEDLAADAHRVLQSMAMLAESAVGKKELAADMRRLADACRAGSCDPVVCDLMDLDHGGRDSAIKISRRLSGRSAADMDCAEIVGLFPDNEDVAAELFKEIQGSRA